MGCLFCNITSFDHCSQGDAPPIINPFYTPYGPEREQFIDELINDIVNNHPEETRKIVRKFKESPLYSDAAKNNP